MADTTPEVKPKKVYVRHTRVACQWVARDGHTCVRFCQKSYLAPGWTEPRYLCCYHSPSFLKKQNEILLKKYREKTALKTLAAREPIVYVDDAE